MKTRRATRCRLGATSAPDIGDDDGGGVAYGLRRRRLGEVPATEAQIPARGGACGPARGRPVRVCLDRTGKPGRRIGSASDVCAFLRDEVGMGRLDREVFYAIHLDTRLHVIGVEEIARGHLTGVEVHPREVFKGAILNNAAQMIVAHNHPSGDPEPSPQDATLTKRLVEAGRVLGIPVRDHVVVGESECVSFEKRGDLVNFGGARPARRRRPWR